MGVQAGAWISVTINHFNGKLLVFQEWYATLIVCYTHIYDLSETYDGCGAKQSLYNYMPWNLGGIIHICHNKVLGVLRKNSHPSHSASKVFREPLISTHYNLGRREEAEVVSPPPPPQCRLNSSISNKDHKYEIQVELLIQGPFDQETNTLIDDTVANLDTKSYIQINPEKFLAYYNITKKKNYLYICLEKNYQFTPTLNWSV